MQDLVQRRQLTQQLNEIEQAIVREEGRKEGCRQGESEQAREALRMILQG